MPSYKNYGGYTRKHHLRHEYGPGAGGYGEENGNAFDYDRDAVFATVALDKIDGPLVPVT